MLRRLRRAFAAIRARARFERDMREELQAHLQHRADDLANRGLSRDEAIRQARVEFGGLESYKEQCRDASRFPPIRPFLGLFADLTLACRRLLATPLFLIFAVISLALGVSVTTTVYSTLYALLWKPLGIRDAPNVAVVTAIDGASRWRGVISAPDLDDLRQRQQSFVALAAYLDMRQSFETPHAAETVSITAVSGHFFSVLGIEAARGRVIQPADEARRAAVLVLSDSTWRKRFAGDPDIVGKTARIGAERFEIVGVAPSRFGGLQNFGGWAPVGWVPITAAPVVSSAAAARDQRRLTVVGRLATGRTVAVAAAELSTIAASLDASYPARAFRAGDGSPRVVPRQWSAKPVTEAVKPPMPISMDGLLLGLTLLVLLVACTNLANLMLSRGALRLHEYAVRRALGASRWRLVREFMVEGAIITLIAGACTVWLIRVFIAMATVEIPTGFGSISIDPELNLSAILFASAALLGSMVVFGLEPALSLTRNALGVQLTSEAGAAPAARGRRQHALIRWQVAISACFFIITAVLARTVVSEARNDSGIALDRLAVTTVHFGVLGWDEGRARHTLDRALALARARPDIDAVALTTGLPFGFQMTPRAEITTPDRPFMKGVRMGSTSVLSGTPELLRTLAVPLVRGRHFTEHDDAGAPRVVIVSELTERGLFGTSGAVGRPIILRASEQKPPETFTVVGVAKQTDVDRLMSRVDHLVYVPFAQNYLPNVALVARGSDDPTNVAHALQIALRQADPDLGTGIVGAASWLTAGPFMAARIAAALAGALGVLTLILATVGLYGVQAHIVAHRTREVGVRMALGAASSQIERMVLRDGFRPVLEGLFIGLLLGTLARAAIRSLLEVPIQLVDPYALALVPIPLAIAAFVASYVPARRAARVDPNVALRHL